MSEPRHPLGRSLPPEEITATMEAIRQVVRAYESEVPLTRRLLCYGDPFTRSPRDPPEDDR